MVKVLSIPQEPWCLKRRLGAEVFANLCEFIDDVPDQAAWFTVDRLSELIVEDATRFLRDGGDGRELAALVLRLAEPCHALARAGLLEGFVIE